MSLAEWFVRNKDLIAAVESALKTLAILAGGLWAFGQYRRRRDPHPKARLLHRIEHVRLTNGTTLLRVQLVIENCGATLLKLNNGLLRIRQITPLVREVPGAMPKPFERELDWPELHMSKSWTNLSIEPNESDSVSYDIVLRTPVHTVIVYSHVENTIRKNQPFGWQTTSTYNVTFNDDTCSDTAGPSTIAIQPGESSDSAKSIAGTETPTGGPTAAEATAEGKMN